MNTKKLFIATAIVCLVYRLFSQAQENPYSLFGCNTKVLTTYNDCNYQVIRNHQLGSTISMIGINYVSRKVDIYDSIGKIMETLEIPPSISLRWLSIDPHVGKYPGTSPYVFVVNSPISNIDADGRDVKPLSSSDINVITTAFDTYKSLFSYTTYNTKIDVGGAVGVQASANVFTTNTSATLFEKRLAKSGLSEAEKAKATAVFKVLTSKDIVEIGIINNSTNSTTPPPNTPSNARTEFRGTTNQNAVNLINDPNKTTESIQSTLTAQPTSGTTSGGGTYGFFPQPENQQSVTPNNGKFIGLLLVNPGTPSVPMFGNTENNNASPPAPTQQTTTNSVIDGIQGIANQTTPK